MNNGFGHGTAPGTGPMGDQFGGRGFQAPPPAPPRPYGFFDSIRRSGWYRPEARTVGGVSAGISARTGWDLVLVRGITLIATIFFPFLLVVYALAWALLPEERDGRIHLEDLVNERFNIAQLGILFFILVGVSSGPSISFWVFGFSVGLTALLSGVGVFILALVGIVVLLSSRSPRTASRQAGPTRAAPAWTTQGERTPGAPDAAQTQSADPQWAQAQAAPPQRGPWTPNGFSAPAQPARSSSAPQAAAAPGSFVPAPQAPPTWTRPAPVVFASVSKRFTLVITGLVLLSIATTFAVMYYLAPFDNSTSVVRAGVIGGGISLLIVGLALAYASFKDRGASWLVALSVLGFTLAWPTAFIGLINEDGLNDVEFTIDAPSTDYFNWSVEEIPSGTSGFVVLDLRDAPSGISKEITMDDSLVTLTVKARRDQPIRFICSGTIEGVSTSYADGRDAGWADPLDACTNLDGEEHHAVAASPTWREQEGITVRIPQNLLTFAYEESARPADETQSSGAPAPAKPQSGAAQSGAQSPQSAPSADAAPTSPSGASADPSFPVPSRRL